MKLMKCIFNMRTFTYLIIMACFLTSIISTLEAQEHEINGPLNEGLFQYNEMDLHVHAGKERPFPLDKWLDIFVHDGRKVLLLLDHLELYRMTDSAQAVWLNKNKVENWYPDSASARQSFMKDLDKAQKRNDILVFRGWEIWEGEIDEGLEKEPMKEVEVIGWHISKAAWNGKVPEGKELITRARQIIEIQKEFHVPMIIFHPFGARIRAVQDAAKKAGHDPASITTDEYRYFTIGEQKELINILGGRSVYIEIEREWSEFWDNPKIREAFIEDIRPLTLAGLKFTVSTDAHGKESFNTPYDPAKYCSDLGITLENVNAIIRELLAIRAKKSLR